MNICPQQIPIPKSQSAQNVLEQKEMFFQKARKNAMQAHIKYKAYYDKKSKTSKLEQADYVYVLQLKANHKGSKIHFTEVSVDWTLCY